MPTWALKVCIPQESDLRNLLCLGTHSDPQVPLIIQIQSHEHLKLDIRAPHVGGYVGVGGHDGEFHGPPLAACCLGESLEQSARLGNSGAVFRVLLAFREEDIVRRVLLVAGGGLEDILL